MHDGITFENHGIPTAVICTEPFISSGKAMSNIRGIPGYPFVVLPHPLGSLNEQRLREKAMQGNCFLLSVKYEKIQSQQSLFYDHYKESTKYLKYIYSDFLLV